MFKTSKEVMQQRLMNKIYEATGHYRHNYTDNLQQGIDNRIAVVMESVLLEVVHTLVEDLYTHEDFESDLGLTEE